MSKGSEYDPSVPDGQVLEVVRDRDLLDVT